MSITSRPAMVPQNRKDHHLMGDMLMLSPVDITIGKSPSSRNRQAKRESNLILAKKSSSRNVTNCRRSSGVVDVGHRASVVVVDVDEWADNKQRMSLVLDEIQEKFVKLQLRSAAEYEQPSIHRATLLGVTILVAAVALDMAGKI